MPQSEGEAPPPSAVARPRASLRRRIALGVAAAIVVAAAGAAAALELRWRRTFTAPYPAIAASTDPAVIAEGEYLVYSAAACAYCHVPREAWATLDRGVRLPLTGHHLFRLRPFGDLYSANLTPDPGTGIGRRSDAELARVLRYGVRADGRAAFPMMEYHDLSDQDVTAVIAYLRSRPAVAHAVPEHRFTWVGKAIMGFALTPTGPATAPPRSSPSGPSPARGAYLAHTVSLCASCHTDRGDDGALVGPPFGGGQRMDVAASSTHVFVTPNLTPDALTSPIGVWSEAEFLRRFKHGPTVEGTPMPWGAYARMRDDDLRSLYRYLRSLPPVTNRTGPVVQPRQR
jgi:mono/diheme cytochrome c family protein